MASVHRRRFEALDRIRTHVGALRAEEQFTYPGLVNPMLGSLPSLAKAVRKLAKSEPAEGELSVVRPALKLAQNMSMRPYPSPARRFRWPLLSSGARSSWMVARICAGVTPMAWRMFYERMAGSRYRMHVQCADQPNLHRWADGPEGDLTGLARYARGQDSAAVFDLDDQAVKLLRRIFPIG